MILGIYGAGGLGREVLELATIINERSQRWDDFIFVIDGASGDIVNGITVYSYDEAIEKFSGNLEISMGIGEPAIRERLFKKLEKDGIQIATLIDPDVYIPKTTTIGKGVTIQKGCFISCNVEIQDYVFIQPLANVGHDARLKEGCLISSYVSLAGSVNIGRYSYVAISVCVKQGVCIGDFTIIGMGSAVHNDIPDEMIAMGNPARPMKRNEQRCVFK